MTPEEMQMLQAGVGPSGMSNQQLGQQLMSMGSDGVSQAPPQVSMAPPAPAVAAPSPQTPTEGMPLIGPGSIQTSETGGPPPAPAPGLPQTPMQRWASAHPNASSQSPFAPPAASAAVATPAKPDTSKGSSGGYGLEKKQADEQSAKTGSPTQGTAQPAGWTNSMEPGLRKQFGEGEQNIEGGIQAGAEAKAEGLSKQADTIEAGAHDIRSEHLQNLHDYQVQQTDAQNWIKSVQTRKQFWSEEKEDPKRLFKTMGAPRVIAMAIGAGLSAAGAALTHTQNDSIELIQKAIDHDIESQRREHESKGKALEDEGNYWTERLRMLGDDRKANAALETEHWLAVDHQIQAEMARTDSQQALANGQAMRGAAQQKAALAMAEATKYHAASSAPGALGPGSGLIEVPIGSRAQIITLPDGRLAHVGDETTGKKIQEMGARTNLVDSLAVQLKHLDATREAHVPGTAAYNRFQQIKGDFAQTLVAQHNAARGIGAIRGEQESLEGGGAGGVSSRGSLQGHPIRDLVGAMVPGRSGQAIDQAAKTAHSLYEAGLAGTDARIVTGGTPNAKGTHLQYTMTGEKYAPKKAPAAGSTPFKAGTQIGATP